MVSAVDIATNNQQEKQNMSNATQTETRGRGRPASFPDVETKMAGYNLPVSTCEAVNKAVEKRNKARKAGTPRTNANMLVNRAILAYLRRG